MKVRAEVRLKNIATFGDLIKLKIPPEATVKIITESQSQGQLDRGPYKDVPVAIEFEWELS